LQADSQPSTVLLPAGLRCLPATPSAARQTAQLSGIVPSPSATVPPPPVRGAKYRLAWRMQEPHGPGTWPQGRAPPEPPRPARGRSPPGAYAPVSRTRPGGGGRPPRRTTAGPSPLGRPRPVQAPWGARGRSKPPGAPVASRAAAGSRQNRLVGGGRPPRRTAAVQAPWGARGPAGQSCNAAGRPLHRTRSGDARARRLRLEEGADAATV
jgi:hypothetical protein